MLYSELMRAKVKDVLNKSFISRCTLGGKMTYEWRMTCEFCKHWGKQPDANAPKGVDARTCDLEPFDIRDMTNTQIAVACGHDGSISYGKDFGCIRFKEK